MGSTKHGKLQVLLMILSSSTIDIKFYERQLQQITQGQHKSITVQDASYSDGGKSDWLSEYLSLPARDKASIYFSSNQIVFICYFTRCSRDQSIWHTCNWFDIKFWQHASCADTKREKSNNLNKGKGGSRELVCGWMGGYNFFESEGKRTFPGPNVQEARCSRIPRISKLIKKYMNTE